MIAQFLATFDSDLLRRILHDVWISAPVWVMLLLVAGWWDVRLNYKRREWIKSKGSVLLEIKLPREISKSPAAMELFINTLNQVGVGTFVDTYIKGRVRAWFSLELVSIEGAVHFFIWTFPEYRRRIETQLYAQYPEVEVHEVPDYTLGVHPDPGNLIFGWFGQFTSTKNRAYPIKTYIDYGLSNDPKEEFKIDPIVSVLEYLGSLKVGEQAWIQIMIQAHVKETFKYGRIFTRKDWKSDIEKEIKEIVKKGILKDKSDKSVDAPKHLSPGQRDVITAIERIATKPAFDVGIRAVYMAKTGSFDAGNIGGLIGSLTHFNSQNLNGFRPAYYAGFEYPWEDPFKTRRPKREAKLLEAYKRRAFFNTPFRNFHGSPFVMTSEELATIFHFPGAVAATPTLSRIPSKKSEAPANLPI